MPTDPTDPPLTRIEPEDAPPEIAAIFDEEKRFFQNPFVPNMLRALARWTPALRLQQEVNRVMYQHSTLPKVLVAMIGYVISTHSDCEYCAVGSEVACRNFGIDDETLEALIHDLDSVTPERIGDLLAFAIKIAKTPQLMVSADYDSLRRHGISDEEIVEIVIISALWLYVDTIADGLKVAVERPVAQVLEGLRAG
jgi:uncharacterized peroxidase-related enzyme